MSNLESNGNYTNFEDLIKTLQRENKELPIGVSMKRQGKYLYLQFKHPGTDKRLPKPCNVDFTYDGIYAAKKKAIQVHQALNTITSASDFWNWYNTTILEKNVIENDLITYREIFEKIEEKFWNSRNKNTKRKRSKEIPNDVATFTNYYLVVFKRFTQWDIVPTWENIKTVLFTFTQGTKSFKDVYTVIKQICSYCPNSETLLHYLADIDYKQTDFRDKQSISLEQFLTWHQSVLENTTDGYRNKRESWLWVCSMCVVYGLRPSEIAASLNLTKPYTKDGVTIPAINNPTNKELLLVLGDYTYFGTTIKTGSRVCKPMTTDRQLIEKLKIQYPKLPNCTTNSNNPHTIYSWFVHNLRCNLVNWNCPVTQAYAFRHLSNQLGEKYGIPQEIRARSLGHSVSVNEQTYKKRSNFQTTVDLLTNHSKQPLSLELAIQHLENTGIDTDDKSVTAILKIIYQLP